MNGGRTSRRRQLDPRGQRRAFTLIELLVVIAVVALVMAILLPTLSRVRKQARAMACRSNVRQWSLALHALAASNDGKLPDRRVVGPGPFRGFGLGAWHRLDCDAAWLCPMATKPAEHRWIHGSTFRAWRDFSPESDAPRPVRYGSYAQNQFVGIPGDARHLEWLPFYWGTVDVKAAARIPHFFDGAIPYTGFDGAFPYLYLFPPGAAPDGLDNPPECEDPADWPRENVTHYVCMNRHDGGINMAFLDGCARKVGLKELWTLKWHKQYNTAGRWTKAGGVRPEDWPPWMRGFRDS